VLTRLHMGIDVNDLNYFPNISLGARHLLTNG
jgi:hypothetical protein